MQPPSQQVISEVFNTPSGELMREVRERLGRFIPEAQDAAPLEEWAGELDRIAQQLGMAAAALRRAEWHGCRPMSENVLHEQLVNAVAWLRTAGI